MGDKLKSLTGGEADDDSTKRIHRSCSKVDKGELIYI